MRFKKLLAVGTVVLGSLSIAGAALASSGHRNAVKPATANLAADTDNVQQGDQTTPDTPGCSTESTESNGSAAEATQEPESSGEGQGTESDGPGGHQDPSGDVNHEFDGEE